MKKLKSLFFFLFLSIVAFAQQPTGTVFENGTLSEALAKAAKNKKGAKLVFVDCYTSWCGPCKNMAEKIFPMEKVGTFFNANFVNIKIDMQKGEGPELAKKFGIKAYPTFLILSAEGKEISRIVGGGNADDFIAKVRLAMNPDNSPKVREAAYEADKTFLNALAYMDALKRASMDMQMKLFLDKNFASFAWYEKYKNEMWPFISASLSDYRSGIFCGVVQDMAKASQGLGQDRLYALLTHHIKEYILAYLANRIEGATVADLQKRVEVLVFVNNGDKLALKLVEIAQCVVKNDYRDMKKILYPYFIYYSLSPLDMKILEKAVATLKGKVDDAIISNYYQMMAVYAKKTAGEYSALADPYTSK